MPFKKMIKALFYRGFPITLIKFDMNLNTSKCMIIVVRRPKLNNNECVTMKVDVSAYFGHHTGKNEHFVSVSPTNNIRLG